MTFGEFRNTNRYIMADVVEFINTNGEEIDIDNLDDEVLQNMDVVETRSDGGYLEIMIMVDLIEKAKREYFNLLAKVEEINKRTEMPTLEELPKLLGISVTQWDTVCDLFDGMYADIILVTIWKNNDNKYAIGKDVEVFDENDYIRNLTDEEMTR